MRIGQSNSNYSARDEIRRTTRNTSGKGFDNTILGGECIKKFADKTRQTPVLDIYRQMMAIQNNTIKGGIENASCVVSGCEDCFKEIGHDGEKGLLDEEMNLADSQESETKTEIIVKPDGSRVLVMTTSVGGMETTMSLEISKPTKALNESSKQDIENRISNMDPEMNMVADEMSNTSIEV